MEERIAAMLNETAAVLQRHAEQNSGILAAMGKISLDCLRRGGKMIVFGNGGSAADAQHMAAELVGAYLCRKRPGIPAIALTVNTSILTAVANDFGYDEIFRRQLEALALPGDLALGISTSGNSPNVNRGLEEARRLGLTTFGFSGRDGGEMGQYCDLLLVVPSHHTPQIQEAHLASLHILCGLIEEGLQ